MVSHRQWFASVILASMSLVAVASAATAQLPSSSLKHLGVVGARYFPEQRIADILGLRIDAPLPETPVQLADQLRDRYVRAGYRFARVGARFDADEGRLIIEVDEGRIDAVEFAGAPRAIADRLARDFALQPGDVFREAEAEEALQSLLRPTHGAIRPADDDGKRGLPGWPAFGMIDRDGKRVLEIHVTTRRSDFNLSLGTEGREDWFSPVDGFAPAVGFNETIFDPVRFNHAYISGYFAYKFGRERSGYALGGERPFFAGQRLFVGAEVHRETASDDLWRLSIAEQSLVSAGFRESFRDYYERSGYQLNAAVRIAPGHEVLVAWRDENQAALENTSDFSLFNSDEPWRPNGPAQPGRLHALLVGYTWDSRGLDGESLAFRYRRHQVADAFGTFYGRQPGWRLEWTSEISTPALGGDFDFRRHVVNLRRYTRLSPRHGVEARLIAGLADGVVPPQRLLSLGGIGSVPPYSFKEATGRRMVLFNVEYEYRLDRFLRPLLLYDAGRVFRTPDGSPTRWMHDLGTGLAFGDDIRVEVFWPLTGPGGAQAIFRLTPTF